jgi:tetratricopeptide (TPR) repeat protein
VEQRSGFGIGQPVVVEVAADAAAQVFGLADIDYGAVSIFVEVDSRKSRWFGGFGAEFVERVYTLIVARTLFPALILCCVLGAQQNPPEPPEEDPSFAPREYALNPVQAKKEVTAGNFYYKKGNYRAAATRYLEATRWDPGWPEAFLKLGQASEKARDYKAAAAAYKTYVELEPDAKNADSLRKKIGKWTR